MTYKVFLQILFLFTFYCGTVYSQNVFFYTLSNLDFGDVFLGYSKTVNHTDVGAAKFQTYQNRANNPFVQITFTLPSALRNGSYSVPITFSSATSAYSTIDSPTGRTNFNPSNALFGRLSRNTRVYFWLGGSVSVPTNIIPGTYSATITATIVVY